MSAPCSTDQKQQNGQEHQRQIKTTLLSTHHMTEQLFLAAAQMRIDYVEQNIAN